jgi:hypothetical protein
MRKFPILATLGAAMIATPAAATDWFQIAQAENGLSVTFVDKDSIRPAGEGMRRVQIYVVLRQTEADGIASMDALTEFDCRTSRRRYVRIAAYDDHVANLRIQEGSFGWRDIANGSQDAAARDFVCSGGTAPSDATSRGPAYPFAAARAMMARGGGQ